MLFVRSPAPSAGLKDSPAALAPSMCWLHHSIMHRLRFTYSARLYADRTEFLSTWASAASMRSASNPSSLSVVLANDRIPWAVRRPWKPMRFKATFTVDGLVCVRGSMSLGKINGDFPLNALTACRMLSVCAVSGTTCSRRFFILSAGMTQTASSISTSCQRAPAASDGRVMVCNCHCIR